MSDRPTLVVLQGDAQDKPPVARVQPTRVVTCLHEHVRVDAVARVARCADCEAVLDPYRVLDSLARDIERYQAYAERSRQEAEVARKELANVNRAVKNAKARLRTAIRDEPLCSCEPRRTWGRFCSTCGGRAAAGNRRAAE